MNINLYKIATNKSILILWVISLMVLLSSCDIEPPEFRDFKNVKVVPAGNGNYKLKADAVFNNPNKKRFKLKSIDLKVSLDDKPIGTIKRNYTLKIPAQKEFTVPMQMEVDPEVLKGGSFLENIMNILGGNSLKVRYTGEVKVSYMGYNKKVPIDEIEEIDIKL